MEITVRLLQEEPTLFQSVIDFIQDPSAWLSVVSIAIAVFALVQTQKQIELSNKHQLFDKRINCYKPCSEFKRLVGNSLGILEFPSSENILKRGQIIRLFESLTQSYYFDSISQIMIFPADFMREKAFMIKLEEIKGMVISLNFLFPKNISKEIEVFIKNYVDVLYDLYCYRLQWVTFSPNQIEVLEHFKKYITDEETMRKKLCDSCHRLYESYKEVEKSKIMEQVEKTIQLL